VFHRIIIWSVSVERRDIATAEIDNRNDEEAKKRKSAEKSLEIKVLMFN